MDNKNLSAQANAGFSDQPPSLTPYILLSAVLGVVAMVVVGVYVFLIATPTYRATATIQIESQPTSILKVDQVFGEDQRVSGYYATQYEILRSRDLARQAVDRIDWKKYPDFLDAPEDEPAPEGEALERAYVDKFVAQSVVQPVIPTLVVRLHFIAENQELAKDAANALAEVYIQSGIEDKQETANRATNWMADRLASLRKRLGESERALQDFREKQNIIATQSGRDVQETGLADNMSRLRQAQQTKNELENVYGQIRQANGRLEALQEIPVLFDRNLLIERAKRSYLEAKANSAQLETRYGPKHPERASAEARLQEARNAYLAQLRNEADGVKRQYQVAAQNVNSLEQAVGDSRDGIQQQARQGSELQVLRRDVDSNQQLYDTLLQEFKKTEAEGQFAALRARIIDRAIVPDKRYRPRRIRSILMAGIGGGLLGLLLAVLSRAVSTRGRYHEA